MNSAPVKTSNSSVKPEILKRIHTYILLLEDTVKVSLFAVNKILKLPTATCLFLQYLNAYFLLSFGTIDTACYIFSHLLSCSSLILKFRSQETINSSFFTSL